MVEIKERAEWRAILLIVLQKVREHVDRPYNNLHGYAMVLIPIRSALLLLGDTLCCEHGYAHYAPHPHCPEGELTPRLSAGRWRFSHTDKESRHFELGTSMRSGLA
jgi:hypothetical protein